MAVITVDDVATAIGRPISDPDEQAQVEQWISDVELLIGARLGNIALLNQSLLAYVEREAVIARMRYREDRNSQASGAGDDTDSGLEHYFLRVLDPWWVLLSPGTAETGAFSVRPSFDADTAWWPAANQTIVSGPTSPYWDFDVPPTS
jgi:hypothetical protein